jgi:hypothetical protein
MNTTAELPAKALILYSFIWACLSTLTVVASLWWMAHLGL